MLDKRIKWAFFLVTLLFAALPIAGIILDVLKPSTIEIEKSKDTHVPTAGTASLREDMVLVPAGSFLRGYNGGGFDEKPESSVMLDAFWIDRYEVTYGAYTDFINATGHRKPLSRYVKHFEKLSATSQPAVYVSWEDADEYCRYRSARLPTEAEWEKAGRGTNGLLWPWGNQDKQGYANTGNLDPFEFTSPVGGFPKDKSPYGVYDMAGNAMEWVQDWYQEDAYKNNTPNPTGPSDGFFKVIKGPSWGTIGNETRLTIRLKMIPEFRDTTIGFRCAKTSKDGTLKNEKKER